VVDAAWEIDTILKIAAQHDVEVTHAFVTHTHPDHVGGHFSGIEIPGVNELLSKCKLKVVVHKAEADALKGLAASDVIKAESGESVEWRFNCCTRPAIRRDRSVSSSMGG
jgi:glyoxylase-like metal-dependent hydrolase (beta-lactamase superfamily II)